MASKNTFDHSFRQNFYSKIYIDDNELIPKNIITCTIREWVFDFLPRIELQILDDGAITEIVTIQDDSVLTIEIGVNPNDPNILEAEFNIVDKMIEPIAGNKQSIVSLTGLFKTNNFFWPVKQRSFSNTQSKNVIKQVVNEIGLKFVEGTNLNTSDVMTWLQLNINNYDFLNHILKRLYVSKSTALLYGNTAGEMIMTSLNNEINKDKVIQAKYSVENYTKYDFKENSEDSNTIWYKDWNSINYTNYFNRVGGYGMRGFYYDLSQNQSFDVFNNSAPLSEMVYRSDSIQVVNEKVFGILNNVYDDYFKAKVQNKYWRKAFFGISILLGINPLYPVKLMDKIELNIESFAENERNEVQSGEYLVSGIVHNVAKKSNYRKMISLSRNGDNLSNV